MRCSMLTTVLENNTQVEYSSQSVLYNIFSHHSSFTFFSIFQRKIKLICTRKLLPRHSNLLDVTPGRTEIWSLESTRVKMEVIRPPTLPFCYSPRHISFLHPVSVESPHIQGAVLGVVHPEM